MAEACLTAQQATPCEKCPWRDKPPFRAFSEQELAFISSFKTGELVVDPGTTVLLEGNSSAHLYTVLSGWAFRYKTLADGRRQILNFALPGDFLGLQSAMIREMDHSVEALSQLVLCIFPRQKIWTLYNNHPGLAFDLTWIASREERMLDEHLLSVGRRSAFERIAYLLVYLLMRARSLGLVKRKAEINAPITQQHVADALGLSLVHTNKTLRKLADRQLVTWKDSHIVIDDEQSLMAIAQWDSKGPVLRPLI